MKVKSKILVVGPLEKVFGLAEDAMRWPELMPQYKYVRLLDEYGNKKVLEMAVDISLRNVNKAGKSRIVPVKWTVIQESIPEERTLSFFHIRGPLKDMEVEWAFGSVEYNDKSIIEVCSSYTFKKYWLIAKYAAGNFFLHDPFSVTLRRLKEIAEAGDDAPPAVILPTENKPTPGDDEDHERWPVWEGHFQMCCENEMAAKSSDW